MSIDEMIAVLQAAKAGKPIECKRLGTDSAWRYCAPSWDFSLWEYRVKPDPRTIWVNEYSESSAIHDSEAEALRAAGTGCVRKAVKFIESI